MIVEYEQQTYGGGFNCSYDNMNNDVTTTEISSLTTSSRFSGVRERFGHNYIMLFLFIVFNFIGHVLSVNFQLL